MDTDQLDRMRSRLEDERTRDLELLDQIEVRRPEAGAHEQVAGEAGAAHRPEATRRQEEEASRREELEQRVEAIDRALSRVDDGTYGTCEVCGAEIPPERLETLPMTSRCLDHAPGETASP